MSNWRKPIPLIHSADVWYDTEFRPVLHDCFLPRARYDFSGRTPSCCSTWCCPRGVNAPTTKAVRSTQRNKQTQPQHSRNCNAPRDSRAYGGTLPNSHRVAHLFVYRYYGVLSKLVALGRAATISATATANAAEQPIHVSGSAGIVAETIHANRHSGEKQRSSGPHQPIW